MKILHLSTSDKGGAGIAAVRLHQSLLKKGIQSKILTLYKHQNNIPEHFQLTKSDYSAFPWFQKGIDLFKKILNRIGFQTNYYKKISSPLLKGKPEGFEFFSFPVSEFKLQEHPLVKEADIIHLHWVSEGFLDYKQFFGSSNKKIVWTLHDMNPFTGGCHHSDNCSKYSTDCKSCPQMLGTLAEDIAQKTLQLKADIFAKKQEKDVSIITPSDWLGKLSKQSLVFKKFEHHNIFNIIDIHYFFHKNKVEARAKLDLDPNKKIILFVSHNVNNNRKGMHYLLESHLLLKTNSVLLCSVGSITESLKNNENVLQLGYITDNEKLAHIYNAADVFVLPSIAENSPNTIVESLLCGTPVIAFNVGGIPEQINNSNGIIVDQMSSKQLAEAIDTFFENITNYKSELIAQTAKLKYNPNLIVEKHLDLYKKIKNG